MAHALLSPSSAERWLHCTPSARLESKMPDTGSVYAREGTLAHALAETLLREYTGEITLAEANEEIAELKKSDLFYPGMIDEVQEYVDFCIEALNARSGEAFMGVEERLDLSAYAEDSFGTGDCVIVDRDLIHIIDLKFGTGQVVDVVENPQLKLYALGAYQAWSFIYDVKEVWVTIAQVRLGAIETYKMAVSDLTQWAEEVVRPRAALAYKGKGKREAGPWCRFCKVKTTCKIRTDWLLKGVKPEEKAEELGMEEISNLLGKTADIKSWIKDLEDYALDEALKGNPPPGFKVVEGRSVRKITDEKGLAEKLLKEGYQEDQVYKPRQIEGITNLTKLLGKKAFADLTQGFIEKPQGKPTLVPVDDKRPEMGTAESEFTFDESKED